MICLRLCCNPPATLSIIQPKISSFLDMASFEKHCRESIEQFGRPFEDVHKWLDEYAGRAEYGYRHRRKRHHEEGIKGVIELFGEEAGRVARMHVISDLKEEGWKEGDRAMGVRTRGFSEWIIPGWNTGKGSRDKWD